MDLIFSEIFKHLGSTVSWYKIAKNTGIGSHSTVEDYIDIFDKLFITFSLNYYSIDQKKIFFNKNKKIYFSDPIILHSIKGRIDNFLDQFFLYAKSNILNPNFLPALMENIVASYLKQLGGQLFYGNYRGKEIDFVFKRKNKTYFIEVKYQNLIHPNDFSFWQEKQSLVVVTKNFTYKKDNLRFIKIEDFLLGELNLEEILV
jgi:predicted AAA+ superfamily ATPase